VSLQRGCRRDTSWFSIIDGEWRGGRADFEAWLLPSKFDASRRQRGSLSELRTRPPEALPNAH
jgi:hypothetical protein